jgi:hypothetical protein
MYVFCSFVLPDGEIERISRLANADADYLGATNADFSFLTGDPCFSGTGMYENRKREYKPKIRQADATGWQADWVPLDRDAMARMRPR